MSQSYMEVETVKKVVNLRDFIEKFGEHEDYSGKTSESTGTTYGHFPYDIRVMSWFPDLFTDDNSGMPKYTTTVWKCSNCGTENSGFHNKCKQCGKAKNDSDTEQSVQGIKYGTFANYYSWIRRFIMESKYYTPRKRKETMYWAETGSTLSYTAETESKYFLFTICTGVYSELPKDFCTFRCGETLICVNESADTFFDKYLSVSDAESFIRVAEDYIFKGITGTTAEHYNILDPFVELPVFIHEEIDDLGEVYLYKPEEWIENKFYKFGEYATFLGEVYVYISPVSNSGKTPSESSSYWDKLSDSDNQPSGDTSYFIESKLKTLLRQKTSVDDSGNILDFVYENNLCNLRYLTGVPLNIAYDEKISAYTYDIISDIKCNGVLPINILQNGHVGDTGKIVFKYVIGNLLTGGTSEAADPTDGGGGVLYEDSYDYVVESASFVINSESHQGKYIKIDYSTSEKPENYEEDVIYSKITIKHTEEEMINLNVLLRYDSVAGIDEARFNNGEISIDRGASSSYEAFNVLGEVNSLDEIEKYHNDWFRIGGKND